MWNWLQAGLGNDAWSRALVVLVDSGVKGVVLLALAGLAALAMRRSSAAARHLVWSLALMGLLLLPVTSLVMPKWQLPLLPKAAARVEPTTQAPAVEPDRDVVARIKAAPSITAAAPAPSSSTIAVELATPPTPAPPPMSALVSPAPQDASRPMAYGVFMVWFAVALSVLMPLLVGFAVVGRLRRRAVPLSCGDMSTLAHKLAESLRLRQRVALLHAGHGAMPMAAGLLRPVIFLPHELEDWPDGKRRVVLLHELAHVKRHDCLTHALARVAAALHWFNPLVWVALRQLRIERERACDDLVLTVGERPSTYANHLLEIARTMRAGVLTSAAAITMAKKGQLEGRLLAVLDAARNRKLMTRGFIIAVVATASLAILTLSALSVSGGQEIHKASDLLTMARQVKDTSLESFFGGWRNLPFTLSADEEEDVKRCIELAQQSRHSKSGVNQFTLPEVREELEAILIRRPDHFYVEYLLGTWHRMNDDQLQADRYMIRAYRHAPVVIVQRYEDSEEQPIQGARISSFALECNRVQKGYLDPSLELRYFNLVSDSEGCIYLPAFKTVFRRNNMSYPGGIHVNYPSLGWFKSPGKVGMLPVVGVDTVGSAYEEARANGADMTEVSIAAIGRRVEWPLRWWGMEGRPVTANPAWHEGSEGDGGLSVVWRVPARGGVSVDLRFPDRPGISIGTGVRSSSGFGEYTHLISAGGSELQDYLSADGRVDLGVKMGQGPWTEIGTILEGETIEADGGAFRLEKVDAQWARKNRWFGEDRPGLVLIDGRYDYDPGWEIAIVAEDHHGNRTEAASSVGAGMYSRRENRRWFQHI